MARTFFAIVGGLVLATAAAFAIIIVGVRSGNRRFIRTFTALQRDYLNPGALRTAGDVGSPYAVIEHVGRKTGTSYKTPVTVVRDGEHLVVGLPYGEQTSWAQNLVAAGEAFVRIDGENQRVTDVAIVPIAATSLIHRDAMIIRLFGIRSAVRMTPTAA
ncbi:nitroreductase family deazaflavin-dependent oxidoreductase (plasmid) [Coraliomargarita sp. W4R53]